MNINSDFDLRKYRDLLLTENYESSNLQEEGNEIDYDDENFSDPFIDGDLDELEEMAKIAGDLKSSIEKVISDNPDLQGLALKKAIKGDSAVINALDGDDLYDNQLNKFIALTKGERDPSSISSSN
jgi:hypothetical protein